MELTVLALQYLKIFPLDFADSFGALDFVEILEAFALRVLGADLFPLVSAIALRLGGILALFLRDRY